ncbi:coiled-coil domain containing 134 [Lamellibrachia satsuma]|nr:coiled-coil domain containing 134 [Lamellibrachia satsuma]
MLGLFLRTETHIEPQRNQGSGESNRIQPPNPRDIYRKLFRQKRAVQLEAVRSMSSLDKYEKQYKMAQMLLQQMFKVMAESKLKLTEAGYLPGDPFPQEEPTRELFAHIVENTAFFGDLLLRLPDIIHDLLKRNHEWQILIHWSVAFANETGIYEQTDSKLLHLMAQELEILERDPDYINPYKEESKLDKMKAEMERLARVQNTVSTTKKKKKEKRKRGPRMSGATHTEL